MDNDRLSELRWLIEEYYNNDIDNRSQTYLRIKQLLRELNDEDNTY